MPSQNSPNRTTRALSLRQVAAIFKRERQRFAAVFPGILRYSLVVGDNYATPGSPQTVRDVAYCDPVLKEIFIVKRLAQFGRNVVTGVIRHELGHAADKFVYKKGAEQRADDIAEQITGEKIRYTRRHCMQTVGRGTYPRPAHLHQ